MNDAEILLFFTEDDVTAMRRARVLAGALSKDGWTVRAVNRLSTKLEDLLLAAKYRAVELPRWVVIKQGQVWHDACMMPSYNEATRILASLEHT